MSTSGNTTLATQRSQTREAAGRGERLYPPLTSRLYWHLTALRQTYTDLIAQHLTPEQHRRLLDFGCGNMPYRSLFPVDNYIGCDFTGNEQADVIIEDDGRLPIDDASVDVVLSSQVLEHAADTRLYLSEAHRVLRPGGLLFLSTHGVWRYHPDPCDFWRWTCDGLRRVVAEGGFEIAGFRGVMGPEATAIQLWQDAVATRIPKRARSLFFRYTQRRIRRADERCSDEVRNKDACVFMVVAQKPVCNAPTLDQQA